jgi:EAL domain-containing protein (putative c-di-GMP-specific phosphodiesterase class I)
VSPLPAAPSRPPAAVPDEDGWRRLVDGVLAEPDRLRLVFQPVVSLQEGLVVGYEALSRFDGPPGLTPDRWFAAADRQGRGAALEAVAVARCLALRASLPPDCFLTVNVSPHLLVDSELEQVLLAAGDLSPLVLELTEHQAVADLRPLVALRDRLAGCGALLALDDAGSGYSGLQQMTQVRPHLIKLDRALVDGADRDEVKLALAELLGEFGGRIDAWLLAEGIETWGELEAFQRLRVPLGQGYLLGRPGPPWAGLDPQVARRLRAGAARARLVEHVASLVEAVPVQRAFPGPPHRPLPEDQVALQVDATGRPVGLLLPVHRAGDPHGAHRTADVTLRVAASTEVVELARRIAARPPASRFDPVVCVDDLGRATGVVRVERVLLRLAELNTGGPRADD